MACDLCGRDSDLVKTKIEGVVLSVCTSCSRHGKVMEVPSFIVKTKEGTVKHGMPQFEEMVIENYSKVIKEAREKAGLDHKELGQKVAERESVLSRVETGGITPDLVLAKKLQKALNIKLIEKVEL